MQVTHGQSHLGRRAILVPMDLDTVGKRADMM